MNNDHIPLHWYCFTFSYNHRKSSQVTEFGECSTYSGFTRKDHFPLALIESQKNDANPACDNNKMVLMAVIYLGYMTGVEFKKGFPDPHEDDPQQSGG